MTMFRLPEKIKNANNQVL